MPTKLGILWNQNMLNMAMKTICKHKMQYRVDKNKSFYECVKCDSSMDVTDYKDLFEAQSS